MTNYVETRDDNIFPWLLVLLEGIAAVILGILMLTAPGVTLFILVQVLGIFLLIAGIFRIVSIFIDSSSWGWKLLAGILGILAGILVLRYPLWSTIVLPMWIVFLVGILALVQGILGLVLAFQGGGWGVGILGGLGIIFGLILVANPVIGVVALPFVLGVFMLVGGIVAIVWAFRLRSSPAPRGA
jgi:uncharacterized membrane protein HdeD (DUF308 family)